MIFTYKKAENIMKIFFSAVLLQLALIALGAEKGLFSPFEVTEMLEYSAAGGMLSVGAGLLFEYILKSHRQ